jgi:hypothetical protein
VKLISGEEAYLSGVSFENAGRNFWAGYVLTRPKLKQSRILKEFGGQSNSFKVHPTVYKGKPIQLIEIESAGSGQGTVESSKSLVYFTQWTTKLITEVEESSYDGRYDEKGRRRLPYWPRQFGLFKCHALFTLCDSNDSNRRCM